MDRNTYKRRRAAGVAFIQKLKLWNPRIIVQKEIENLNMISFDLIKLIFYGADLQTPYISIAKISLK